MILTKALLGLIARGEKHGYRMKGLVDVEYFPYWRLQVSQLYRSLARMTRYGWVKSHAEVGVGPDRKVYHLTPLGHEVLGEWLSQPAEDHDEFFVKWRMARELDQPVDQLVAFEQTRIREERDVRTLALRDASDAGDINRIMLAQAALCQTQAELTSLEFCEALLVGARAAPVPLSMSSRLRLSAEQPYPA